MPVKESATGMEDGPVGFLGPDSTRGRPFEGGKPRFIVTNGVGNILASGRGIPYIRCRQK